FGEFFLKSEYIGELSVVALPPELRTIADPHELRLKQKRLSLLERPPGHHCIDAKLPPDRLGVLLLSLVLECGGARHALELRHVGKSVDQAFGDAVRQKLGFRSCGRVDEWQDGDGADAVERC